MSTQCENCKALDSLIEDINEGEIICSKCGLVYQENVVLDEYENDNGYERFIYKEKKKHAKKPEETKKSVKKQKGANKIKKIYLKPNRIEPNLDRIRNKLLNVGVHRKMIETTLSLYNTIIPKIPKINFDHIIAALYYYALRIHQMPQSYKQVAKTFSPVTERQIKKAFNKVKNFFNDNKDEDQLILREKNLIQLYLDWNVDKYDAKMLSFEIIKNINDNSLLDSRSPNTVAGLALLLAYKLLGSTSDINKEFYSAFSNKVSISKSFEKIKKDLKKIIPKKYSNKIKELNESKI